MFILGSANVNSFQSNWTNLWSGKFKCPNPISKGRFIAILYLNTLKARLRNQRLLKAIAKYVYLEQLKTRGFVRLNEDTLYLILGSNVKKEQ